MLLVPELAARGRDSRLGPRRTPGGPVPPQWGARPRLAPRARLADALAAGGAAPTLAGCVAPAATGQPPPSSPGSTTPETSASRPSTFGGRRSSATARARSSRDQVAMATRPSAPSAGQAPGPLVRDVLRRRPACPSGNDPASIASIPWLMPSTAEELIERALRREPASASVTHRSGWSSREQAIHTPALALATMLHHHVVIAHGSRDAWAHPDESDCSRRSSPRPAISRCSRSSEQPRMGSDPDQSPRRRSIAGMEPRGARGDRGDDRWSSEHDVIFSDVTEHSSAIRRPTLAADDGSFVIQASRWPAPVRVYFYPKDDTPGCTAQACGCATT